MTRSRRLSLPPRHSGCPEPSRSHGHAARSAYHCRSSLLLALLLPSAERRLLLRTEPPRGRPSAHVMPPMPPVSGARPMSSMLSCPSVAPLLRALRACCWRRPPAAAAAAALAGGAPTPRLRHALHVRRLGASRPCICIIACCCCCCKCAICCCAESSGPPPASRQAASSSARSRASKVGLPAVGARRPAIPSAPTASKARPGRHPSTRLR